MLAMPAALAQPDYSGDCSSTECHGSLIKHPVVHAPAADSTCDACHEPSKEGTHRFTMTEPGSELCLQCHDEYEGDVLHHPVANDACTVCHDPHASDGPKLLTEPSVALLCQQCHEDVTEDLDFLHGPVAAGACTACHNAHASDVPKLLSAKAETQCLGCHKAFDKRRAGSPHVHEPVKQGCLICHNPHGGENKMNLIGPPVEVCLDCHEEILELVEDAAVKHGPIESGKACMNCHSPHMSVEGKLLLKASMPLCVSCHDKTIKSGDRTIANIAAAVAAGNPHGPILEGNCVECHDPHGGENASLLAGAFPAGFYAAYDEERYALCFECHEVEAFEEEETDEGTNFRNGEQNLHFLHVNRDVKGRSCRACHDPHGGKHAAHIAESVPFGDWRIPINFKQTSTGGSCQPGCHRLYRYERTTPIVNLVPANSD